MNKRVALAMIAAIVATPAFAHVGADAGAHHGSFADGLTHPLTGLDHILAAFTVGLWAVLSDSRRAWLLPCVFVAAMSVSVVAGAAGVVLPFTEPAIAGGVLTLGLLVALAVRAPTVVAIGLVTLFALVHGNAHGAEGGSTAAYLAGLVVVTALLHVMGVAFGRLSLTLQRPALARGVGAAIALAGMALLVS